MRRRTFLSGSLAAAGCATPASAIAPSPHGIGARIADAWLRRDDFMRYDVGDVHAVHYAEVACAYGAAKLARAAGDAALFARVAERHERLLAADIPNTANHVDANVYGAWPLEVYLWSGEAAMRDRGLEYAELQWRSPREDGLSQQTRFWIDDIWMIGALQLQAFRATGDAKYIDRAARTASAYVARLQRPNGLIHHGPEAPFFWGRGNGWVAAGLAEVLTETPPSHREYGAIVAGYRRMMDALLVYQAEDGMWRQLIDYPHAWKETSCTAMFGYAMQAGVRRGLLDDAHRAAALKAWRALEAYISADGNISEVCVGTGQSQDAQYYLDRPRATGDLHGQAPMLWFAAELAS